MGLDALMMMPPIGDVQDRMGSLLSELQARARVMQASQPWRPDGFSQQATALHEGAHVVVAHYERFVVKSARIYRAACGNWVGHTEHEILGNSAAEFFALMRVTIAGRRAEMIFRGEKFFCVRSGLHELALVRAYMNGEALLAELAEVDEILFAHRPTVYRIADLLIRDGEIKADRLASMLAPILPRTRPPRIRDAHELRAIAHDPLL